ncbi:MAG: ornithine racemase [Thermotogota bacterium]|nr:ornithine racemase [Thermotogota bacterium]
MYPKLIIRLNEIRENAKKLVDLASRFNVEMVGVTKVVCGEPVVASAFIEAGIKKIGDSRLDNIERMKNAGINAHFQLIRSPMLSEVSRAASLIDSVLVSELSVMAALDRELEKSGRKIEVIYMIDLGELREGCWHEECMEELLQAARFKHAHLTGIGTNLGCFYGVLPTPDKLKKLVDIANTLKEEGAEISIISGGNTATIYLMEEGTLPEGINQFRVGEALILGTDVTGQREISFLSQNGVELQAEIIEVKKKPSRPASPRKHDAFGRDVEVEDLGTRIRAILALGEQDVMVAGLKPLEKGVRVLHGSSDHIVVDVTESAREWKPGDVMRFGLSYGALLRATTSPYVRKVFEDAGIIR